MRTPCHCLLLIWLLGAIVCAGAVAASAWPDPAALDEAVADALSGKQTSLDPAPPHDAVAPPPAVITVNAGPLGGFFELLAYALLAAGLVLIITMILQRMGVLDRDAGADAAPIEPEIETATIIGPQVPDAAVTAAGRGEFGEALRLLLGEVLPRFYRGRGHGWPESWTSRQCLRRVGRAEPAHDGLAELVAVVERHHFGGLPAGQSDWETWQRRVGDLQPVGPAEGAS